NLRTRMRCRPCRWYRSPCPGIYGFWETIDSSAAMPPAWKRLRPFWTAGDMVFIDPPYNVAYQGKTADKLKIRNDELGDKFYEFLRQACTNVMAVCHGGIYICMSSSELHTLYRAFTEAGGHWSTFVIWAKHHFTLGRSDY